MAAQHSESEGEYVLRELRAVGIFADVPDPQLQELAGGFAVREIPDQEVLMREGDRGEALFVLAEGRLRVERTGPAGEQVHLGDVLPGECVGDMALLRDAPRGATVTASAPSTVLVLGRDRFRGLLDHHRATREAVEAQIAAKHRWDHTRLHRPSATEVVDRLAAVLAGTPRAVLERLEPEVQWVALPRETVLMREGERADSMFFIVSGRLSAYTQREDGSRLTLNEMGPGESVGEMALLGMGPRTASVAVLDDAELLRLSRRAFDELLNSDPSAGAVLARIMAARLQRALKVRSAVAQMRAVPMISAQECDAVTANPHLVLRNLKVTEGYYRLSVGMTLLLGHQDANWLTYACSASKTVGSFIRGELPMVPGRRGAVRSPVRIADGFQRVSERLPAVRTTVDRLQSAVERVSDLTSAGNIKVFAELGPIFAKVIAAYRDCDAYDRDEFERFLDSLALRPGDSLTGGQDALRQALVHYHDAMFQPEPKRKAELILLANFKVGLHEQIRLQPNIEGAMNAPLQEGVFDFPGGAVVRDLVMRGWRRFATKTMMRYRLPYGAVAVSGDLPLLPTRHQWPDVLVDLEHPELRMVADRYGTPSGSRWLATRDWANLDERMQFIFRLFRSRQKSLELFDPPFQYAQRLTIAGDQLPGGPL